MRVETFFEAGLGGSRLQSRRQNPLRLRSSQTAMFLVREIKVAGPTGRRQRRGPRFPQFVERVPLRPAAHPVGREPHPFLRPSLFRRRLCLHFPTLCAAINLTLLPSIIVYILLQEQIQRSLAGGGIRG